MDTASHAEPDTNKPHSPEETYQKDTDIQGEKEDLIENTDNEAKSSSQEALLDESQEEASTELQNHEENQQEADLTNKNKLASFFSYFKK